MDDKTLKTFLKYIQLKILPDAKKLSEPINKHEIQQAVSALKNKKGPGPDVFTNGFYKILKQERTLPL